MIVVLDYRALETPLPDVAATAVEAMKSLRVRDQQALHDAADGQLPRADQQMDVVAQKAITVEGRKRWGEEKVTATKFG